MSKMIITVLGKDTVGIIARVCTYLADHQMNIEDISQTIVQGYFNMMMIVDVSRADIPVGTLIEDMEAIGQDLGVKIRCQSEEIFTSMHRI